MMKHKLSAALLALCSPLAFANTVTSDMCSTGARDFSVTAVTVAACLQVGPGNISGNASNDPFLLNHAAWVLIDKSDDTGGAHDGWLSGALPTTSGSSGTFFINAAAYTIYDTIAIGFKSGEGQLDPDWAVFELADNTFSGNWSISGKQALSHANLYGYGTPAQMPEPGTLALLALAGFSLAALRRWQKGKSTTPRESTGKQSD
jgi:hypothetical protein